MTEYHVGCGMSGILAGTVRDYRDGRKIWAKKSDVTDEALGAVAEYLLDHDLEIEFSRDGREYVLKVEEACDKGGDGVEREPPVVREEGILRVRDALRRGDGRREPHSGQARHVRRVIHRMRLRRVEGRGCRGPVGIPVRLVRQEAEGGERMKVYVVYIQYSGLDYYDLANAEVYLNKEDAQAHVDGLMIGDDSIDIDDAYVQEYEVKTGVAE